MAQFNCLDEFNLGKWNIRKESILPEKKKIQIFFNILMLR